MPTMATDSTTPTESSLDIPKELPPGDVSTAANNDVSTEDADKPAEENGAGEGHGLSSAQVFLLVLSLGVSHHGCDQHQIYGVADFTNPRFQRSLRPLNR